MPIRLAARSSLLPEQICDAWYHPQPRVKLKSPYDKQSKNPLQDQFKFVDSAQKFVNQAHRQPIPTSGASSERSMQQWAVLD
jgi:hypothetical protein